MITGLTEKWMVGVRSAQASGPAGASPRGRRQRMIERQGRGNDRSTATPWLNVQLRAVLNANAGSTVKLVNTPANWPG